ncbi:MAG: hypothetical protein AAGC67_03990 [Myxococcota bacterium]
MALTSISPTGSTPIGGPVAGRIADEAGALGATLYGGVSAITSAGVGPVFSRRLDTRA